MDGCLLVSTEAVVTDPSHLRVRSSDIAAHLFVRAFDPCDVSVTTGYGAFVGRLLEPELPEVGVALRHRAQLAWRLAAFRQRAAA